MKKLLMPITMLTLAACGAPTEGTDDTTGAVEQGAGGCNGSCVNKSPITTGCDNDSVAVYNQQAPIYGAVGSAGGNGAYLGYVELRWSAWCQANWARVVVTNSAMRGKNVEVVLQEYNYGGRVLQWFTVPSNAPIPYYIWTGMWDGQVDMRGCGWIEWANQANCTNWG
ncbi:DUF2690 domain-containing protein [Archangium violaceum]|uniref:DUF2690 domain-containing protein n=1 Tax=Archangium violaceum TaxID=83451 RepID=UPI00194EE743|nr:DUF2690 domain-containing protein [Archangium violaceum]QRN95902.1 DUF2690 domain-containing protein [Archangium violaceum]